MLSPSLRQRLLFVVIYVVSGFFVMGCMMPLGDEAWVAILAASYALASLTAVRIALTGPPRYCTVLKAVALAGLGSLIPFLLLRAFF